jgi:hypothetical protein
VPRDRSGPWMVPGRLGRRLTRGTPSSPERRRDAEKTEGNETRRALRASERPRGWRAEGAEGAEGFRSGGAEAARETGPEIEIGG